MHKAAANVNATQIIFQGENEPRTKSTKSSCCREGPNYLPEMAYTVEAENATLLQERSRLRTLIAAERTEEEKDKLVNLLCEFSDVWYQATSPGTCTSGEAQLEVVGRPYKSKLRPMSEEVAAECRKQLDVLLAANLIRPSKSEWSAAPLLWDFLRFAAGEKSTSYIGEIHRGPGPR
eukprot:GHVS01032577.1.p1 GENE.GHVS01032577.1~~GHVS01032577.1.p1  ORF type:complete len:177 (-),score=6.87 GHVS01032577.1:467-997(-)